MDKQLAQVVSLASQSFPKNVTKEIKYGTAGFRSDADELDFIMFRMGLLAALRAKDKKEAVGVMITASHNPVKDNGVKLVDPAGEMLAADWELHATALVNVPDASLDAALREIVDKTKLDVGVKALVVVGRDTRPSSDRLHNAVVSGIKVLGGEVMDLGVTTTPILHYVVFNHNDLGQHGEPTAKGYYKKLSQAFVQLRGTNTSSGNYQPEILYDGANGVGALAIEEFVGQLGGALHITRYNKGDGVLNHLCGADFVKVQQKWPGGVPEKRGIRCVSVDGDADRVIYSYIDSAGHYHMLDGDKIATLIAGYLKELLTASGLGVKVGLVQTAYANGASTAYIKEQLGVPVTCAKTGVKFLHHKAQEFDIGVYFEANGHGTVIFSAAAKKAIRDAAAKGNNPSAEKLKVNMDVINETVGDAISDMLMVETVLHARGWSADDWNNAYTDLPNRQMKVKVADRCVITTTDAERICVTPAGLQDTINKLVSGFSKGRAFVRPSGTEDVVRVYAEAATQEETDKLAVQVACAVHDQAGGTGDRSAILSSFA